MKRKILCALMLMGALTLPITAQAAEVKEDTFAYEEMDVLKGTDMVVLDSMTLSEHRVVTGDLHVYGPLNLNGYNLQVYGNVYAEKNLNVGDGTLTVGGNYRQESGVLYVSAGNVTIGGNLQVYGTNVEGEKVTGNGMLEISTENGSINVDGDMILDTNERMSERPGIGLPILKGNITVKGDLIQEKTGDGFTPQKIVLSGSEEQTLQLLNNATIGNLKLDNPKVKVAGYLNATLGSSAKEITLDDGVFETSGLNLNGYTMNIPGNVVATGDVNVGSSTLGVTGNYRQESGTLSIGAGKATIGGDLQVYGTDVDGEKVTGNGAMHLQVENSALNVDGDMILDTTRELNVYIWTDMLVGTITLKGDLIQEQSGNGFGPAKLIMAGSEEQTLQLLNNAVIGNLKLDNPKVKVAGYLNATLGSSAKEITLDDGVFETSGLNLNGYTMNIPGNVIATGDVNVGSSTLGVAGNYRQESGALSVGAGKATIGGDLQVYGTNVDGEKVTGDGAIHLQAENSTLNVDGNMVLNTTHNLNVNGWTDMLVGTLTLKGDLIQEKSGNGFGPEHLILAGDKDQTVTLLDNAYINELKVSNDIKVNVTNYFNATLGSSINVVPKDGVLYSTGMNLNGYTMNVTGKMAGQGDINVGNGILNVSSDYLQQSGALSVGKGKANIAGDLLVQTINTEGEYATGNGYLKLTDASGNLKIDGNLLLNTTANMRYDLSGKITIAKDLLQVVSGEVNPEFKPSYVYMAGQGAQKVDLASPNAWIDTLELGQEIGNYTFNPEPCWNTLIQMKVENPFADVQESSWQYSFVKYALDNNLMSGKGKDESGNILFDPESSMTRAEFVQTLYNKEGKPAVTYSATFTDVREGQWYTSAILWAAENNIVAGKGDKFDVGGKITRQEMATVLFKYANYSEYETSGRKDFAGFVDYDSISSWAINNMKWALHYGIMSGKGDKIDPIGNATRAECATMLRNFIKAYEE